MVRAEGAGTTLGTTEEEEDDGAAGRRGVGEVEVSAWGEVRGELARGDPGEREGLPVTTSAYERGEEEREEALLEGAEEGGERLDDMMDDEVADNRTEGDGQ